MNRITPLTQDARDQVQAILKLASKISHLEKRTTVQWLFIGVALGLGASPFVAKLLNFLFP